MFDSGRSSWLAGTSAGNSETKRQDAADRGQASHPSKPRCRRSLNRGFLNAKDENVDRVPMVPECPTVPALGDGLLFEVLSGWLL